MKNFKFLYKWGAVMCYSELLNTPQLVVKLLYAAMRSK
jgi:hypothetical protein